MKKKILLSGKNTAVIADMFTQLSDTFELMTSSAIYDDLMIHAKYFQPDLVIYCMSSETKDNLAKMSTFKSSLKKTQTPFAVFGSDEDYAEYTSQAAYSPDLVMLKPLTVLEIRDRILLYFKDIDKAAAEEAQRIAEEKALLKRHILIVDDDPMMLKIIKEQLHDDYIVATAPSGKFALKYLETKTADLILLDYEMPVENGPQVLEKLRDNPSTSEIPVVFLTGVTDREKIANALALKPQGYLLKPIDHEKLMETITKFV